MPDFIRLREALDSPDPTRALIAALLAYHAVRIHQLRDLRLIDFRDGRLSWAARHLLADPVRDRLGHTSASESAAWPSTVNPHLFVNVRSLFTHQARQPGLDPPSARHVLPTDPPGPDLREAGRDRRGPSSSGRPVGLSVASAARYASVTGRITPPPAV